MTTDFHHCGEPDLAGLQDLMDREMDVCHTLLQANRAVEHAASALDLEDLDRTLGIRRHVIRELTTLVGQAGRLPKISPPRETELEERRQDLERLMEAVEKSEEQAGRAILDAVDQLRKGIQTLDAGRQGLKGYRGSPRLSPRFADRRW